jgi:glycogen(starch) synthase
VKIGFFVYEYPPQVVGGLGTYAQYITHEYIEMGHDVTVFTLNPRNLKTTEVLKGVEVHRPMITNASNIFPMFVANDLVKWGTNIRFFSDIFMYNVLSATKFVNQLIKKEKSKFDIVCVHDWLSSIAGIITKNETNLPLAFHVHSTEWGRSGDGGSEVVSHFEQATAQLANRIITVSYAMRDDLTRHGWNESKISVVWNGVDTDRYNPKNVKEDAIDAIREKYGTPKDWNLLLFIGRLTWVKSIRNLVQAMPLILQEYPKTKLVILGKGEEQSDITEMTSRLGIRKNVICRFDFVPEDERILHYAAADTCIFPSVYEPFGIVSLEAMAMEKPIIVGAQGVVGFREQVIPSGPDQTGIHVNGQDPADIAWGVKEVLKDPQKAKEWGQNGRKRTIQLFTWKKVAEQTTQIYKSIMAKDSNAT